MKNTKKQKEAQKSYKKLFKAFVRIQRLTLKHIKWPIVTLFVTMALTAAVPFGLSKVTNLIIDEVISIIDSGALKLSNNLKYLLAGMILLRIFDESVWAVLNFIEDKVRYICSELFTIKYLEKVSQLDIVHYESSKTYNVIEKAKDSYSWRPATHIIRTAWFFKVFVSVIVSVAIFASLSPLFLAILTLTSAPLLYVNIKAGNTIWFVWDKNVEIKKEFWSRLDTLTNEKSLMELRIFNSKNKIINEIKKIFNDFHNEELRAIQKAKFLDACASGIAQVGIIAFYIYIINEAINGRLTIGEITFYTYTANGFSDRLNGMFRKFAEIYSGLNYIDNLFEFFDLKRIIKSGNKSLSLDPQSPPKLEFKDLNFRYSGAKSDTINGLNLIIEPGEKLAIVGENGAGKSTLVKLLSRFYDPTQGEILADGVNIKRFVVEDWHKQIGVLYQDFTQYGFLPVQENIGIGNQELAQDLESVQKSANNAGAHEFIKEFDKGYDQRLSKYFEGGTDLSGGQWQRIALARGFFRNSPIIILDEPTSAIDAKAESEIFDKLYEYTENKTVIIISHRFSTVRKADKIIVLDKGQIIEAGTHEELLKLDGKYKAAFDTQAKGYV